jgi:hypothetical protein
MELLPPKEFNLTVLMLTVKKLLLFLVTITVMMGTLSKYRYLHYNK